MQYSRLTELIYCMIQARPGQNGELGGGVQIAALISISWLANSIGIALTDLGSQSSGVDRCSEPTAF
jgi:hypothetical protein